MIIDPPHFVKMITYEFVKFQKERLENYGLYKLDNIYLN